MTIFVGIVFVCSGLAFTEQLSAQLTKNQLLKSWEHIGEAM